VEDNKLAQVVTRYRYAARVFGGLAGAFLLLSSPGALLAAGAETVTIELERHSFSPEVVTVRAGETVRLELVNKEDIFAHNFTLQAADAGLDLDVDIPPQKTRSVEIRPTRDGSYTFYCNKGLPFMKTHRELGMEGTLKVLPAGR
jgi:plastocyanin